METAAITIVAVLFAVAVALTCILCCFSCDSKAPGPQGGPGRSFTVATFSQEASLFTGPGRHAQAGAGAGAGAGARDFWTFM